MALALVAVAIAAAASKHSKTRCTPQNEITKGNGTSRYSRTRMTREYALLFYVTHPRSTRVGIGTACLLRCTIAHLAA